MMKMQSPIQEPRKSISEMLKSWEDTINQMTFPELDAAMKSGSRIEDLVLILPENHLWPDYIKAITFPTKYGPLKVRVWSGHCEKDAQAILIDGYCSETLAAGNPIDFWGVTQQS